MIGRRSRSHRGPRLDRRLRSLLAALAAIVLAADAPRLSGQALPAATGPGSAITVGATASGFHVPYGQQNNFGFTLYADANLTQHLGLEAEARWLRLHTQEDTRSSNYLIGPRVSARVGPFRPYGKVLFGSGRFTFPFAFAKGSYFAIAPGAGLDLPLLHGRAAFRVIDFEYQDWPDFTFGAAHPYGISTGLSVRVW